MIDVDVVILSLCDSDEKFRMNCDCLGSLIASEENSAVKFHVAIVESNPAFELKYNQDVDVVIPKEPFNYNRFVNIGLSRASRLRRSPWFCISNNDVIFTKGWMDRILHVANANPGLQSFSPYDPNSKYQQTVIRNAKRPRSFFEGYRVRSELVGWCIIMRNEILTKVAPFDEQFDYYYQDNDYSYTLRRHNIKHALVPESIVYHLESMTSKAAEGYYYSDRGAADEQKFLDKWGSYKSLHRKNKIHGILNRLGMGAGAYFLYSRAINF